MVQTGEGDKTARPAQEEGVQYRVFAELTSDFYHVCVRQRDGVYRIQWVGGQFERISGYSSDELYAIGCWLPLVHPEDQERTQAALLRMQPGDDGCIEFRIVRKDHAVIWIREHTRCTDVPGIPGQICLYGTARDITAQREVALIAQSAETAYRAIFNSVNDAIFVHDLETGMILDVNRCACTMYGCQREEMIGTVLPGLAGGTDNFGHQEAMAYMARARDGEPQVFEWVATKKDGTCFWVEISLKRSEINGRNRILAVVRDVSERKQHAEQLQKAQWAADMANRTKSEFLANMSHEVRTPLNGIMGLSQLLRTTELSPEQLGYLEMLDRSSLHLLSLINDILDISKIEAGSLALDCQPFSFTQLLREVMEMYAKPAAEKGIELQHMVEAGLPLLLMGDPLRLRQVLVNLLGNAVKFTSHGGVWLRAGFAEGCEGGRLFFEVADSGIGMSQETIQRIFHPFTQADSSIARLHGGSGLGLAICKRLTELMGGVITVESSLGHGSSFRVELPFKVADESVLASPGCCVKHAVPSVSLKVLLVEDQDVNRTFVQRLLERHGHQIIPAVDGLMALDLLARDRYDLMLLDIQMPGMGGEEVLARLRQSEQERATHLPVIALTAHALAGDREKLLQQGFDGYVSKPVQLALLLDEMAAVLAAEDGSHTV